MFEISKKITIEMGHRLPNHTGKCRNLHGHSYEIEVFISASYLVDDGPEEGMVKDYVDIKEAMKPIDVIFDHALVLCIDDPMLLTLSGVSMTQEYIKQVKELDAMFHTFSGVFGTRIVLTKKPPTAEVLGLIWMNIINNQLARQDNANKVIPRYDVTKIVVKETASSSAIIYGTAPTTEHIFSHKEGYRS